MPYKYAMSLLKRAVLFCAAGLLMLVFVAGCKSPATKAPPTLAQTVPAINRTNQFQPPVIQPSLPPDSADNMASNILAWDAVEKEYQAKPGEMSAPFIFNLTNVSPETVMIYDTSTTCDCTVASLPSKPWIVPSGGSGQIQATIDLHNKIGVVTNRVIVFTSKGNRALRVKAIVRPETP
jgi:hypothetical protein